MKDMENRLQLYEFQQKMPIKKMEHEVLNLHNLLTEDRLPMNQVVDLDALEVYIRQEVLKAILHLTPQSTSS